MKNQGFFNATSPKPAKGNSPKIYWHSSESMHEVNDESATLLIGASVFLGKGAGWGDYAELYTKVYNEEGWRILDAAGYFVVIQTDAYVDGRVMPRNTHLPRLLMRRGWELVDVKIWQRRAADFFQPPFSQVFVFGKPNTKTRITLNKRNNDYFQGVWNYKQTAGGAHNAYPEAFCKMLIDTFTLEGDLIVDPFAGTCQLLHTAQRMGRRGVGYEIDDELRGPVNGLLGDVIID